MPTSIIGWGTTFIGKRDYRPDESYVTTEFVTAFYLPLVPLRSFRVGETEGSFRWLGPSAAYSKTNFVAQRVPLCWIQVASIYTTCVLCIASMVLFFVLGLGSREEPGPLYGLGNGIGALMMALFGTWPLIVGSMLRTRAKRRVYQATQATEPQTKISPPAGEAESRIRVAESPRMTAPSKALSLVNIETSAREKGERRAAPLQGTTGIEAAGAQELADQEVQYYLRLEPESVAEVISGYIGSNFSSTEFNNFFEGQASGLVGAGFGRLAVWHSLGYFALVVAVWTVYRDKALVLPILSRCRAKLSNQWGLPEGSHISRNLVELIEGIEAAAFDSFTKYKGQKAVAQLYFRYRYVYQVCGMPVFFPGNSTFEDQLVGMSLQGNDALMAARTGKLFASVCDWTKGILEECRKAGMNWSSTARSRSEAANLSENTNGGRHLTHAVKSTRKFNEAERVRVTAAAGLGKAIVGRDIPAMQEFYRGAALNSQGRVAEGRQVLKDLLAKNRIATVDSGTQAVVLQYAVESGPEGLKRVTPWERLVQVRLEDGEAPELKVWMDDGSLERIGDGLREDQVLEVPNLSQGTERKLNPEGYETLFVPPTGEAKTLLSRMTEEEKLNLHDLLGQLQAYRESSEATSELLFHSQARAALWGVALAKIADHYRNIGRLDRALFFSEAAWGLSKYPVFAYNAALLAHDTGDNERARALLQTYLAEYRDFLTSPTRLLVNPDINADELESVARSARAMLAAI